MSKDANGGGAAGGGSGTPPWAADAAILRRVFEKPPTFPCIAPAHTVGRWLRDAARLARRLLPDEVWPRVSLGTPSPGDLTSPAPDLRACLWWLNRMHEVFILGLRTEDLDDAVICTLADLVANPPIREGSKFRPKLDPDWISKDTGRPEPTIVLDLGRVTMRVGLSALIEKTITSGYVLLAHAEGWRGQIPSAPASNSPKGDAMPEPALPRVNPDQLRALAGAFRDMRDRLLRLASQIQDGQEGHERLKRLGAQGGRLLDAAIRAGAGDPFDQWSAGPVLEPEVPGMPPSEVNEELWWMQWRSFSQCVGPRVQPLLPGNFGRTRWQILSENKAEGIIMFTGSQPVADPAHVWRDRIEDHAGLCGLVAEELVERADRAQAAAEEANERDRRVLNGTLDALEEILDDSRVRREFCRRVTEAAEGRHRWIIEQCLPQLREAVELSHRVPDPPDASANQSRAGRINPFQAGSEPPAASAESTDSILLNFLARGQKRTQTPEELARDEAFDRYAACEGESQRHYDAWAKANAAQPPLCCAFLWRWHRRVRPAFALLPELSPDYAATFDPAGLPVAEAADMLEAVRKELEEVIGRRRPLAADSKADGWTKLELCQQAEIGETTFDRIAKKAGVMRADSGQHGYRYGQDELEKLIAACATPGKRRWPAAGERWQVYLAAARKLE